MYKKELALIYLFLQAFILYGSMTGTSKMFSTKFTKCLDQIFQTKMLAMDDASFDLLQNIGNIFF